MEEADEISAEASYWMAYIEFEDAKYDESLEKLFALNNRFGSYAFWINRSYLLIAENYIRKEELFQAKATLRSIIQHSKDEEARYSATVRLEAIEANIAADTIKSIDN